MAKKQVDKIVTELEQYRLREQLTHKKLAKLLDVTPVTISRWMNGHRKPAKLERWRIERLVKGK